MKIKELLNAHPTILRKLRKPELESVYKNVSRALKRRYKTFEKHGAADAFREDLAGGMDQMPGTKNELVSEISEALAYMRKPEATYSGYRQKELDRYNAYRETVEKQIEEGSTRRQFEDLEDFREFGNFMKYAEMKTSGDWSHASDQAVELYEQAKRLGIDSFQLNKNFEYWREHLDKLSEAEPISWSDKGRKVYASDYARKLGLPSIRKYNDEHGYSKKSRRRGKGI